MSAGNRCRGRVIAFAVSLGADRKAMSVDIDDDADDVDCQRAIDFTQFSLTSLGTALPPFCNCFAERERDGHTDARREKQRREKGTAVPLDDRRPSSKSLPASCCCDGDDGREAWAAAEEDGKKLRIVLRPFPSSRGFCAVISFRQHESV